MEKRHVGMGNAKEGFERFSKKNIEYIRMCYVTGGSMVLTSLTVFCTRGRGKFLKKKRNNFSPTRIIALTSRW